MLVIPVVWDGEDNYVFPYLDNHSGVSHHYEDGKEYFVIDNCGEYYSESEHGLLIKYEPDHWCVSCDEGFNGDGHYTTSGGEALCDSCYEEYYFTCDKCDEVHYWENNNHELEGSYYCHDCFVDVTTECIPCGERVGDDDIAGRNEDGDSVCNDCRENDGLEANEDGVLVDPNKELEPEEV